MMIPFVIELKKCNDHRFNLKNHYKTEFTKLNVSFNVIFLRAIALIKIWRQNTRNQDASVTVMS